MTCFLEAIQHRDLLDGSNVVRKVGVVYEICAKCCACFVNGVQECRETALVPKPRERFIRQRWKCAIKADGLIPSKTSFAVRMGE